MTSSKKEVEVRFITDNDINHIILPSVSNGCKTPKRKNDNFLDNTNWITPTRKNKETTKISTPVSNPVNDADTPKSSRLRALQRTNEGSSRRKLLQKIEKETDLSMDISSDESMCDDEDKDKTVTGLSSEGSDAYSDSDSEDDYKSETDISEEEVISNNEEDKSDDDNFESKHPMLLLQKLQKPKFQAGKHMIDHDEETVFKSDYYFLKKSEKSRTSANTLSCLNGPKLMPDKLKSILHTWNNDHAKEKEILFNKYRLRFCRWLFYMLEGFNLLLYGHGSKRNLLNFFQREYLSNNKVLVVNGFFPGLTIKDVLETFLRDILNIEANSISDPEEAIRTIKLKLRGRNASHVFLIVHNIDGDALHSKKQQTLLAKLTSIPNVHMIASFDHINTPLLWSKNLMVMFNFLWINTTTYDTYRVETSFETSLFIHKTGSSMIMSSLVNVFSSLTLNTQRMFLLLIKDHLENKNNKKFQGVQFSDLYSKARNAMLVTSDLALRTQLTEFVDHEIIKWRRDSDTIFIPIPVPILIQFYDIYRIEDEF